jgi:hypothetical protein
LKRLINFELTALNGCLFSFAFLAFSIANMCRVKRLRFNSDAEGILNNGQKAIERSYFGAGSPHLCGSNSECSDARPYNHSR